MPNPTAPPVTLAYRTPAVAPPLPPAWRTACGYVVLACWAVPLVAGVGVWVASEVVRYRHGPPFPHSDHPFAINNAFTSVIDVGLTVIFAGTILTGVGGAAIVTSVMTRWRPAVSRSRQVAGPALVGIGLLASNFAVAVGLIAVVSR